jgi:Prokaryotic Cytochrome C oxidase subunit IV
VNVNTQPEKAPLYNAQAKRRSLIVLLILVAITLGYLALDRTAGTQGAYRASSVVTTIVIGLALVKARLIFREFMQVRDAPTLLRRLTDLWVLLIGAALIGSYFLGLAVH